VIRFLFTQSFVAYILLLVAMWWLFGVWGIVGVVAILLLLS
jgi:hypothetical protein